jgi:hypothetical protein
MSERVESEEIAAQIELRMTRVADVISDLTAILVEDMPNFFVRQGKHAFLANAEKAHDMSPSDVRALKDDVSQGGLKAASDLKTQLSDVALWTETSSLINDNKTLVDCAGVWSKVKEVESSLQAILVRHGLAGPEAPVYKAPLYFVSGRYFPALAEHFWRLIGELGELEQERGEAEAQNLRSGLSSKWDDA